MKQLGFLIETGDGIAVSLPNYDDNHLLVVLVPRWTAITAMCFDIGGRGAAPKWLP